MPALGFQPASRSAFAIFPEIGTVNADASRSAALESPIQRVVEIK